jgi:signal transduction histidine kinase
MSRRRQLAVDVGLALGLMALTQWQVWTVDDLVGDRAATAAAGAGLALALAFRRHRPLAVTVVICAFFPVTAALGWNTPDATFFPSAALMLCSYSVAAHGEHRTALVGAALVVAVAIGGMMAGDLDAGQAFFLLLFNAAAWSGGWIVKTRERDVVELAGRFDALEREADERARVAAAEERARIARELHDVVSHGLSGIVLEAAGAERSLERDGEAARSALRSIQQAGRDASDELRRLLGLMRSTEDAACGSELPNLSRAEELAERARRAGATVDLDTEGDLESLPAGLQLTSYRIVQEALTNVLKHARGAATEVAIRRTARSLEVEVTDRGGPPATGRARPGHGLVGMRERVALYGGELEAGPLPGGGFSVHARFPLGGLADEHRGGPRQGLNARASRHRPPGL